MAEDIRGKAQAIGLDRLTDSQLERFDRAVAGMERPLKRVPHDLPATAEPAHVYRAKGPAP